MNSFFIFKFRTSIVLLTVLLGTTLAACAVPGPQAAVSGALDSNVAPVAEWTVEAGEAGGIAVGPGGEVFVIINHDYRVVKYQ